ncbi:MAG: class I SAM-dependent methyltransferase [Pseudomonadales bacterium]|nr:class I SAM-dependent methyltransferase [Pseudomonadales bacterium]MDP7596458.1 class I SAM-dependent methyltransferase [Pseudomonadales bacterium]HJN52834.1 class I SAM-dependent methyltransferase [Pseudomonadales bacterium]
MATHQEIAHLSDEDLVNRMTATHDDRFDAVFWSFFDEFVDPHLADTPHIADVGCGPGLFLRDLRKHYPQATLFGSDVTGAMIDYASSVVYAGQKPELTLHDVTKEKLPFEDGQMNLISMVAVMHVLDDPFAVCREIKRAMSDDGIFLLQDWVRTALPDYLDRMTGDVEPDQREIARGRLLPLFTVHNKYTLDDWLWLLQEAGFKITEHRQLRSQHFCTFVCRKI